MDLANTFREERKSAELQHLDKDFYQQVGVYLVGLGQELSRVEDPFGVEAQILQDTLKSEIFRRTAAKQFEFQRQDA